MKIVSLFASNVYGYIDLNISFNDDITFLIGGNGSGKTTVLRLLQAVITPNIKDIITIPFEKVRLILEEDSQKIEIFASKNERSVDLSISGTKKILSIPNINNSDKYILNSKDDEDEIYQKIERDNFSNEVYLRLKKLDKPIFLGLDRKTDFHESNDYMSNNEIYYRRRTSSPKRRVQGTLGEALINTEMLIQETYRRIRDFEEHQGFYLRDQILKSSFKFTEFNLESFDNSNMNWRERQNIIKRKEEIKEAIHKIGKVDDSLIKEMDSFFNKITMLFEELKESDGKGFNISWLVNKAQIDRVADILDVIDSSNSRVSKLYSPIISFQNIVNDFLSESNKRIEINTVGRVEVVRPDGTRCLIDSLSSGERQLIIMTANVLFNKKMGRSSIIIIDEPELSLHMRWQEMFSEKILSISPRTQFIMATHSPEIVGNLEEKGIRVGR
ncbi:AAA family ATPase [Morganella morganii]|uniref:AAA family ATPase n=1 Tax=Morganella morganii TaxID=582 RepID=UPI001BDA867B|nr:AAA family ATPase [Morganella morganii]ELA8731560.1 AAA family ATPase [Morganella morganii]ELB1851672.1 AAA family ATPase [Morganella morganii]MBT0492109.1 AAA family ATPase [Morganella morganii subsp. morganii]MBT0495503.1 AAA family ATPase [Morganella morganii subsp. morganii]QWL93347.1 AAA family ATPase [Morganella morganii subsp. morganii]